MSMLHMFVVVFSPTDNLQNTKWQYVHVHLTHMLNALNLQDMPLPTN